MKLGARSIPTMVFALLLGPALFADDSGKPAAVPHKERSTISDSTPAAAKSSAPTVLSLFPPPVASTAQMAAGEGKGARSDRHARRAARERENNTPKAELFLGYSFWRAVPDSSRNRIDKLHGGSTSLALNFSDRLGLVFDFAGFKVNSLEFDSPGPGFSPSRNVDAEGSVYSFLVGPRFSFRNHERLTPFVQFLGGVAHADDVMLDICTVQIYACRPLPEENAFALTAGGGLDYRLNHRVALRLFQAEYLLTRFRDPTSLTGEHGWQNNVRLSTGLVFRFGGDDAPRRPANREPVASCSIDKTMLYAGSSDGAVVRVNASDPDNDPLTYSWTTSGGTVEGSGPEARWNSSGTTPGTYKIKVRVDDGRGGDADCSAEIRIEPQPNRAPTMSCSGNHNSVLLGESVDISASASDPDNDALTYSWNSSGGRIRGTGASVKLETTGLKAGRYSVTGHVDDSHGGTADCQLGIELQEPPPPPEMVELEKRLDLHSIYFQTARPTVANPNSGLVPSQEKILTELAKDFQRYLTFRPEAHLILGAHADERGSVEYNKGLTERRVERTRNFLSAHGVPATSIETRSFGKEDNLNAEQVKHQIEENPDLTPDDRKQMLGNLQVMVLANNRRVDVALSTTGQKSTRRYPFNARDFLALISTQGGESSHPARAPRRKKAKP